MTGRRRQQDSIAADAQIIGLPEGWHFGESVLLTDRGYEFEVLDPAGVRVLVVTARSRWDAEAQAVREVPKIIQAAIAWVDEIRARCVRAAGSPAAPRSDLL